MPMQTYNLSRREAGTNEEHPKVFPPMLRSYVLCQTVLI